MRPVVYNVVVVDESWPATSFTGTCTLTSDIGAGNIPVAAEAQTDFSARKYENGKRHRHTQAQAQGRHKLVASRLSSSLMIRREVKLAVFVSARNFAVQREL